MDGAISQFGRIERDQVFQAKGHRYSTTAPAVMLFPKAAAGDAALAFNPQWRPGGPIRLGEVMADRG